MKHNNYKDHDFDKMLKDLDLNDTIHWETHTTATGSKSYPFWKAAIAGPSDTFKDFQAWLDKQKSGFKEKDLTGVVKAPKVDFDLDNTLPPVIVGDFSTKLVMDEKKLFFDFLDTVSANNKDLLESVKNGYYVIFENTTSEQVDQIRTKLSINQASAHAPQEHSLDELVPKEEVVPETDEFKKLEELF